MRKLRNYTLWILGLMFCAKFAFAQNINVRQFKLDNGLTIVLNEDHSRTEVLGMVMVKAGAKNDPHDATGMAHYQEHMLFKGTTELGTSDWDKEKPHIDRIIKLYDKLGLTKDSNERLKIQKEINKESIAAGKYTILNETSFLVNKMGGTNLNAGTGWDQTVYYNSFPPNQINKWIELYSHRFINPVFRAFQAELETVYEEKNMYQDNFITNLLEAFNKNFYKKHPYGQQTIIGTTEHLKNPSLSKMYEFYNTYYVANNMAVILVGDFDSEAIIPLLKEKFGKWKSKNLPNKELFNEMAFKGREQVTGRYSPIKLGILGFRTVPAGHEDELALNVFSDLLYNEKQTGILNKLVLNGELMEVQSISQHMQDYGADLFLVIPKLIGQKMEKAENIVLNAVRKIRDGGFDISELEQSKKSLSVNFQLGMEDYEKRANALSELLIQNKDVNEINSYSNKLENLTKDDVVKVAKKYFGDNYLAFYSKMGSPKLEKLEKPGYDPVTTNTKANSVFAARFEEIKETPCGVKFVDFENDIKSMDIAKGCKLYCAKNPKNDIYTADIVFKVGSFRLIEADLVCQLMNVAGTKNMSRDVLQKRLAEMGCSYEFYCDAEEVSLSLKGMEKNVDKALALIGELIKEPIINDKDIAIVAKNIISARKYEREDPSEVAQALIGYVMYGNNTKTIHRLRNKEIKRFKEIDLYRLWSEITSYECDIHYTGMKEAFEVKDLVDLNIDFSKNIKPADKSGELNVNNYSENEVFFIDRKGAIQSNIFFLVNGETFSKELVPVQRVFNTYYGGGFSGIVLQEVREYRSLAYTAGAWYVSPGSKNLNNFFIGNIGTQADKTLDAIKVFFDIKENMPEKPDRMSFVKPYVQQECITARPNFRMITHSVEDWKKKGYNQDPSISVYEKVESVSFTDIKNFYEKYLKERTMVTVIVGDKSRINMEELSKYGKINILKEKDIYTK